MNSAILSRPACNALRGLAIIGIFLHNYCHWLGPTTKSTERLIFPCREAKNIGAEEHSKPWRKME